MKYSYIIAWQVLGGLHLPAESDDLELFANGSGRFLLTRKPNPYLALVDRGNSIRNNLLTGLLQGCDPLLLEQAIATDLAKTQRKRSDTLRDATALLYEGHGLVSFLIKEPKRNFGNTTVAFDVVDARAHKAAHRNALNVVRTALALESCSVPIFKKIEEGFYLHDSDGTVVYSLSPQVSAEAVVSSQMKAETIASVKERVSQLSRHAELESTTRLLAQYMDSRHDKLRSFFAAWSALEILIAKAFKAYESSFFSPLLGSSQANARERFVGRMREVMKDKYRLSDKFFVVSAVLFPEQSPEVSGMEVEKFLHCKKIRDLLVHGESVPDADLPVGEAEMLLHRYLRAYTSSSAAVAKKLRGAREMNDGSGPW